MNFLLCEDFERKIYRSLYSNPDNPLTVDISISSTFKPWSSGYSLTSHSCFDVYVTELSFEQKGFKIADFYYEYMEIEIFGKIMDSDEERFVRCMCSTFLSTGELFFVGLSK